MKSVPLVACLFLTGCNFAHRHPVIVKVVPSMIAVPVAYALSHQHTCPSVINGYPYSGTPPCPNPATYDPGRKR